MRLPRSLTGADLIKALESKGYRITRQTGSHVRLTTERNGTHHITVPNHDPLRIGTLAAILKSVAAHLGTTKETLAEDIF